MSTTEKIERLEAVLKIFENLPEKKFARSVYAEDGCFCAVGAIMKHYGLDSLLSRYSEHIQAMRKEDPNPLLADNGVEQILPEIMAYSTGHAMLNAVPLNVLEQIQMHNDDYHGNRRNRYFYVTRAIKQEIKDLKRNLESWGEE